MQDQLKVIFGGFVALLLAVAFIQIISNNEKAVTRLSIVSNESVTLTSGSGAVLASRTPTAGMLFFGNMTNNTDQTGTPMIIGSTVNLSRNGTIVLSQTFAFSPVGPYNISYQFEGSQYVNNPIAKSFISLNTLFFAIAILFVGLIIALKVYPELLSSFK